MEIMHTTTTLDTPVRTAAIARRLPVLFVLAFGMIMLYGVGFATTPAVHNAVHDTRHANGFPCH